MEEGEKSTRYFLPLQKSRRTNETIHVISKDNLDTVTEIQDLLSETHTIYEIFILGKSVMRMNKKVS